MKRKKDRKVNNIASAMLTGLLVMTLIQLACCVVISILIFNKVIGSEWTLMIGIVASALSSLLGAYIAGKRAGGKYAIVCIGTTAINFLFTMLCGVLCFSGKLDGVGWRLCTTLIGSVLACLLCTVQKKEIHIRKNVRL